MLLDDHPAATALKTSACDLGRILDPIKICKGRIVDGRARLRAARAAGLVTVPTAEVAEEEVASIVLQSLLARKHFTKSALAYLSYPLLEPALAEARKRQLSRLRVGEKSANLVSVGNTVEEIAENLGIGRNLLFQTKEIRKKLAKLGDKERAKWEAKILSEDMGIGQVQQALSGQLAGLDGKTHSKGDTQQLYFDLFRDAENRFTRWDSLDAAKRKTLRAEYRKSFSKTSRTISSKRPNSSSKSAWPNAAETG